MEINEINGKYYAYLILEGRRVFSEITFSSRIKTVRLYVFYGYFHLKVNPRYQTEEKIEKILKQFKLRENLVGLPLFTAEHCYINGEKKYFSSDYAEKDDKIIATSLKSKCKIYDSYALKHFTDRVEYYRPLFNITVPINVKIKEATHRMAFFNVRKNEVTFNPLLFSFAEEISDCIVIHELGHYFFHNHGKEFKEFVISSCSNYSKKKRCIQLGYIKGENNEF